MVKRIIILFALATVLGSCSDSGIKKKPVLNQKIGPVEAEKGYDLVMENINNPAFVIIDVRSEKEFDAGHIPGAVNIEFNSGQFGKNIGSLDRNKTYLLYCRTGLTSEIVISAFKDLGFREAYHIFGGLTEWIQKGYPVVR